MLMEVIRELESVGVHARILQDHRSAGSTYDAAIEIREGDRRWDFVVEVKSRAPYPNEIEQLDRFRKGAQLRVEPLLIAPFITEGLGEALTDAGWSWADLAGNTHLRADGLLVHRRTTRPRTQRPSKRMPQGTGGLTIIRRLIASSDLDDESRTTTALAKVAGVTQPRASQVLSQLRDLGLVESRDGGWRADRGALLDRFLTDYRGPGGTERFYYSLASPREVAVSATTDGSNSHCLVSADVAPDVFAPWLRPRMVILYSRGEVRTDIDIVDAIGPSDANVIIRNPRDQSIFAWPLQSALGPKPIPTVDFPQMIWDLEQAGGDDRAEAAGELKRQLLAS